MARLAYSSTSPFTHQLNMTKRWASSLGFWGVGAGAGAFLFLSVTPLVRSEVLVKVPVLKAYFEDTTPASDKPF
ncbi:ubiquinol-cytochrome-c reductase complex subunit-domain-containing protein [Mycena maculata]|uniref:Ubiquinol-cytochrome-c reductase complex subunit-domain-containing protein n=1 Tax=Mycena maculata TaxID=230809 RepID=A0AAD7HNV6_9AGAR|nr:ubiquinol-cytochrome-c reductase complex subunit-domain-containing protein [Mycena maculata]